jgi:hypothetical protein
MIESTADSTRRRFGLPTVILGLTLIAAAQAQAQQPAYPTPGQTYPSTPPAYPNPSYPAPNPTYPNPVSPNPAFPNPPYPSQQPGYPNPGQGYPGNVQLYPGYPGAAPPLPQPSHFFRDLFAQTLAVVLQSTTGGLLGTIAGRIMEWFTRKGYNAAAVPNGAQYSQYPNAGYPGSAYASTTPGYPNAAYPTAAYPTATPGAYPGAPQAYPSQASAYPAPASPYSTTPGYPNSSYPTTAYAAGTQAPAAYPGTTQAYTSQAYPSQTAAYPGPATAYSPTAPQTSASTAYPTQPGASAQAAYGTTTSSAPAAYGATPSSATLAYGTTPSIAPAYGTAPPQVYDATTGQPVTGAANPYATRGVDMENAIYAGIAYEVQVIGADGQMTPVNTVTYEFHTGDKFMLVYRPSLPGHMEIYNVNAAGQKTLIDSSDMAAGQMTKLGPYQFSNQAGDESLRLVLSPCTNPQLQAKTRDIVKLDSTPPAASSRTLKLPDCGAPTARGADVRTRDIQKVGVEDTTSFALDPISPKEMISG